MPLPTEKDTVKELLPAKDLTPDQVETATCPICYRNYSPNDKTLLSSGFSCPVCHRLFHFSCLKVWAKAANASERDPSKECLFRCPSCYQLLKLPQDPAITEKLEEEERQKREKRHRFEDFVTAGNENINKAAWGDALNMFQDAAQLARELGDTASVRVLEEKITEIEQKLGEERNREIVSKLKDIVQVSKRLEVSRLAQVLEMDENELWKRIFRWAKEFGFVIDKDVVEFGAGQKDAFIAELEHEFAGWHTERKKA